MDGWRDKEEFTNTLIYFKKVEGDKLDIFLEAIMNKIDNPLESNLLVPNGLRNLLIRNFPETSIEHGKHIKIRRFRIQNEYYLKKESEDKIKSKRKN